jgi:HEPN domain-containing protein
MNDKRYIHAAFMCHLAVEKALKGLYASSLKSLPPKTHNLFYLSEKIKLNLPEELSGFLAVMNGVSIVTRYPDELQRMRKDYNKAKTKSMLDQSKGLVKWLKEKL